MRLVLAATAAAALIGGGLPVLAQPPSPPQGRPPLVQPAPPRGGIPPAPRRDAQPPGPRADARPSEALQPVVRDETFTSQSLGRQMKYRVVLPAGYDASSQRYPVLYLLHGLNGSFVDWETKTHLVDHLRGYRLIIVTPDAGNSWYTNSAGTPADRFEDYVAKDLVEAVDARFRTIATRHGRAIAGLSMGGYGGLKFGVKFPGTYAFAAGFSGALSVMRRPEPTGKLTPLQESLLQIYGPPGSQTRAENDLLALAAKADAAKMPYFYLDCGTEDGLLPGNREFAAILQQQKIPYEFRELPGAHTWSYWDQQLPEMLRVLAAHVDVRGRF